MDTKQKFYTIKIVFGKETMRFKSYLQIKLKNVIKTFPRPKDKNVLQRKLNNHLSPPNYKYENDRCSILIYRIIVTNYIISLNFTTI